MRFSVLRPAAVVVSAVLAGSVFAVAAPAAAVPTGCVATELKLPAGLPSYVHSDLNAADSSGRYQVGSVSVPDTGERFPVLWTDGEPQRIDPEEGVTSLVVDVTTRGVALGITRPFEVDAQPWLYSAGKHQQLQLVNGVNTLSVAALNDRGDVVGSGRDKVSGNSVVVIWPADGSSPRALDSGKLSAVARDISEAGVVLGETWTDEGVRHGMLWERWDAPGLPFTGKDGAVAGPRQIRGTWYAGVQDNPDGSLGGALWSTLSTEIVSFPTMVTAVNSSGDVAYESDKGPIVERRDGTQYRIDADGFNTVRYLFERGSKYDAAGGREHGFGRAVLWSGCSS